MAHCAVLIVWEVPWQKSSPKISIENMTFRGGTGWDILIFSINAEMYIELEIEGHFILNDLDFWKLNSKVTAQKSQPHCRTLAPFLFT